VTLPQHSLADRTTAAISTFGKTSATAIPISTGGERVSGVQMSNRNTMGASEEGEDGKEGVEAVRRSRF
jgi:hypothetical protein